MTSFARTIALAGMLLMVTPSAAALQDQPHGASEADLVVGADAVLSVASSGITADGTGNVTVQSWQGGAESPRGASESGVRVRLAPSETHPLGWEVEAIDLIFVS